MTFLQTTPGTTVDASPTSSTQRFETTDVEHQSPDFSPETLTLPRRRETVKERYERRRKESLAETIKRNISPVYRIKEESRLFSSSPRAKVPGMQEIEQLTLDEDATKAGENFSQDAGDKERDTTNLRDLLDGDGIEINVDCDGEEDAKREPEDHIGKGKQDPLDSSRIDRDVGSDEDKAVELEAEERERLILEHAVKTIRGPASQRRSPIQDKPVKRGFTLTFRHSTFEQIMQVPIIIISMNLAVNFFSRYDFSRDAHILTTGEVWISLYFTLLVVLIYRTKAWRAFLVDVPQEEARRLQANRTSA